MNNSPETPDLPAGPAAAPEPETPLPEQNRPASDADSAKFFQWLRGLGIQRGSNRWIGGVCSGLANKWGIDPVIVRGLAVVLTLFFGVGLLAYGVAWALLPEPDGRIHVEEVGRGRWSTGMTGAAILTLLGFVGPGQGFIFGGEDGWFPWPLFLIGGIAWLIYWAINNGKSIDGTRPAQQPRPYVNAPAPDSPTSFSHPAFSPSAFSPAGGGYAPTQPFAPNPQMYVKRQPVKTAPRLGAAASLLTLGLAAIVGAAVLLMDATSVIDLHGYQASVAAAAAAITAAIAIVIAGFMGRSAGGLGTFAVIALVFAGLFSVPPHAGPLTAFNDVSWTPATSTAAEAGRTVVMGNGTFDLTQLGSTSFLGDDLQVPIRAVAASVTIKVPANIPVTIKSELAAASLTINGKDDGGALAEESTTEINPDATGKGIVITLEGAASSIDVITVDGK
ncbi:PspC domain-containing protein [Arthrobacter sp. TWP1-1]|uniref:PspC domain-containing protein n=1 Tax=Arthrobacter sp. TWP1-1 TaxID=2804568 RepID=UPI003CF67DBE